jgi:hypothetical protein
MKIISVVREALDLCALRNVNLGPAMLPILAAVRLQITSPHLGAHEILAKVVCT